LGSLAVVARSLAATFLRIGGFRSHLRAGRGAKRRVRPCDTACEPT
jgi:hypothetical protein